MIELRELTVKDGLDVYDMLQEIGPGENGFDNSLNADTFSVFQTKLHRYVEISTGLNLDPGYVPQTVYWLYSEGKPVGYGKFRHYLNDKLLNYGGHIGYVIRPAERHKGYGKILLSEILKKARHKGLERILITCDVNNAGSRGVIEANQGILTETKNDSCFYWIELN